MSWKLAFVTGFQFICFLFATTKVFIADHTLSLNPSFRVRSWIGYFYCVQSHFFAISMTNLKIFSIALSYRAAFVGPKHYTCIIITAAYKLRVINVMNKLIIIIWIFVNVVMLPCSIFEVIIFELTGFDWFAAFAELVMSLDMVEVSYILLFHL